MNTHPHATNSPQGSHCAPGVNPPPSVNPEQRLTVKQVASLLGVGISTVWKMTKEQRLPAPERYGQRCSRWRLGSVLEVISGMAKKEGGAS